MSGNIKYKPGQLKKILANAGGEDKKDFVFTKDAVAESFDDLINKLKENLKRAKHTDGDGQSNLGASIDPLPVRFMGSKILIELKFDDYGLDVDKGTKPKGYNAQNLKNLYPNIQKWINQRPSLQKAAADVKTKYKLKDLSTAKRTLSFLISRSILKKGTIKRFGYKGSNWFSKEVGTNGAKWKEVLTKKISDALGRDVSLTFKTIAQDFKK